MLSYSARRSNYPDRLSSRLADKQLPQRKDPTAGYPRPSATLSSELSDQKQKEIRSISSCLFYGSSSTVLVSGWEQIDLHNAAVNRSDNAEPLQCPRIAATPNPVFRRAGRNSRPPCKHKSCDEMPCVAGSSTNRGPEVMRSQQDNSGRSRPLYMEEVWCQPSRLILSSSYTGRRAPRLETTNRSTSPTWVIQTLSRAS